jgi:membrane protease YdiL (CAAX protease family)
MEAIMQQTATTIAIQIGFTILWISAVIGILIAGQFGERTREFRTKMLRQWKAALAIALLHALGAVLGGVGLQFSSVCIFCEALIGLALAYSLPDYEPLPVTQAVIRKERWTEAVLRMLGVALAVVVIVIIVGVLQNAILSMLGETIDIQGIAPFFPRNIWQNFFLLLAGAGISEETLYRLVLVSLFWRLTRRPWVAIVISAVLFGAYHLSPLDALYLYYWERPITIFTMSTVMGIVMGYVYLKYGYETAVLGHTFADWIPMMLARLA